MFVGSIEMDINEEIHEENGNEEINLVLVNEVTNQDLENQPRNEGVIFGVNEETEEESVIEEMDLNSDTWEEFGGSNDSDSQMCIVLHFENCGDVKSEENSEADEVEIEK